MAVDIITIAYNVLKSDGFLASQLTGGIYYYGQIVNGKKVYQVARTSLPQVFDDTVTLTVRPTIFLRKETENPLEDATALRIDFFSIYMLNVSIEIRRVIRSLLLEIRGDGIFEVAFQGSNTDFFDSDLGCDVGSSRFTCKYLEGNLV